MLAPTLKSGKMVILDNLPAHKVAGLRVAIEATGARRRLLLSYSPDFNPIELGFSKLRAILHRRGPNHLRTMKHHWQRLAAVHTRRMHQLLYRV